MKILGVLVLVGSFVLGWELMNAIRAHSKALDAREKACFAKGGILMKSRHDNLFCVTREIFILEEVK